MSRGQIKNNSSITKGNKQNNTSTFIKGRIYSIIMDESHPFFINTKVV